MTYLAKWKTTAQMVAIPVLLLAGVFEWDRRHNAPWVSDWFHDWMAWILSNGGLILIWVAGLLTHHDRLRLPDEGDAVPARPQAVRLRAALFRLAARAGGRAGGDGGDRGRDGGRAGRRARARATRRMRSPSPTSRAVRVAVDEELADLAAPLAGVREVAFFPPMTGG